MTHKVLIKNTDQVVETFNYGYAGFFTDLAQQMFYTRRVLVLLLPPL